MNRPDQQTTEGTLIAGVLCLDFANTADWHARSHPEERLNRYEDLVAWGLRAGLVQADGAERLLDQAKRRPNAARAALGRATTLREIIYRIAVACIQERPPASSDVDGLSRALASAFKHLRFVRRGKEFVWIWEGVDRNLDAMLWSIVYSAANLLTSDSRTRIGQCADDRGCGWLFLDSSKNRSRRWCEMKDCGNRAKARRHYQRIRRTGTRREGSSSGGSAVLGGD